jgi:hypothetical protein
MTFEDRDLLLSLRRQQEELQQTLETLNAKLGALEARARDAFSKDLPPVPRRPHRHPLRLRLRSQRP